MPFGFAAGVPPIGAPLRALSAEEVRSSVPRQSMLMICELMVLRRLAGRRFADRGLRCAAGTKNRGTEEEQCENGTHLSLRDTGLRLIG